MAPRKRPYSDTYWENKEVRCSSVVPLDQDIMATDVSNDLKNAAYLTQWIRGCMSKKLRMLAEKVMKVERAILRVANLETVKTDKLVKLGKDYRFNDDEGNLINKCDAKHLFNYLSFTHFLVLIV
jgi:hypothetical protein